jgi:glycosyltransferase involved in cell wall biosynthesis
LWICGAGNNPKIDQAIGQDSRIKFFGLVTEQVLTKLYQDAHVFINPRPSSLAASKHNFPSKILQYLSYGKPVISTWTDGLSPNYRDVLIVIEEESPTYLAKVIEQVSCWDIQKYQEVRRRIKDFMTREKLWNLQAQNALDWLNEKIIC